MAALGWGEDDPELDGVKGPVRTGRKAGAFLKVFRVVACVYIDAALDRLDIPALFH